MNSPLDGPLNELNQGSLQNAIIECNRLVAKHPMEADVRVFLAQLLAIDGNWSRAGVVVDQVLSLDREGKHTVLANQVKLLIEAEKHRAEVWQKGALPNFLDDVGSYESDCLWLANCFRDRKANEIPDALSKTQIAGLRVEIN